MAYATCDSKLIGLPCEVNTHERARAAEATYKALSKNVSAARGLMNSAAHVDKKVAGYKQQQNNDIASQCGDLSDVDASQPSDEDLPMSSFVKASSSAMGSKPLATGSNSKPLPTAVAKHKAARPREMSPVPSLAPQAEADAELSDEQAESEPPAEEAKPAKPGKPGRGKRPPPAAKGSRRSKAQSSAAAKAEALYTTKSEAHTDELLWEKKPRQRQVEACKKQLQDAAQKLAGDSEASDLMEKMLQFAEHMEAVSDLFSMVRTTTWELVQEPMEDSQWQLLTTLEYSLISKIFVFVAGQLLKQFEHPETTATFMKMLAFTSSDNTFGLSVLQTNLEQKSALQMQLLGLWYDRVFRLKDLGLLRDVIAACLARLA
eukprot:s135_g16.t1